MTAETLPAPRFVRKTQLAPNEYRKNFHQIDRETITALTSVEADMVTPLMSKVYLRLVNAPARFWEREGVLRFEPECEEENRIKAWKVLCDVVGVASATARKALAWMHEEGIIGYYSGKNGVGIRIFLNRAVNSVGTRQSSASKKILDFAAASRLERPASQNEAAFKDSYAVLENLDTDINPLAPKNGADDPEVFNKTSNPLSPTSDDFVAGKTLRRETVVERARSEALETESIDEIVRRLRMELEPCVRTAATQAAAREHQQTREWFESKALPKAVRVAQRESFDLLRKHGTLNATAVERARTSTEEHDPSAGNSPSDARPLSFAEIEEVAEMCAALWEAQGKSIEVTLSEISSEGGGWLLPDDAPKVREAVQKMVSAGGEGN